MTSPRSTYGGGYYSAPSFPDTPIYDSLVAERGTPQIAPIRVPSAYDTGSNLPALPAALPALPSAPSTQNGYGYPSQSHQAPMQPAPAPHIPQQASGPRGYGGGQPQQQRPFGGGTGYEAMRPATPRPAPNPHDDPYYRQHPGRGY